MVGAAEISLRAAAAVAYPLSSPVLAGVGGWTTIDEWACRGLDTLENFLPALKQPTKQVGFASLYGVNSASGYSCQGIPLVLVLVKSSFLLFQFQITFSLHVQCLVDPMQFPFYALPADLMILRTNKILWIREMKGLTWYCYVQVVYQARDQVLGVVAGSSSPSSQPQPPLTLTNALAVRAASTVSTLFLMQGLLASCLQLYCVM